MSWDNGDVWKNRFGFIFKYAGTLGFYFKTAKQYFEWINIFVDSVS